MTTDEARSVCTVILDGYQREHEDKDWDWLHLQWLQRTLQDFAERFPEHKKIAGRCFAAAGYGELFNASS